MNCPRCQQPILGTPRFCGKCGQMLEVGLTGGPQQQPALTAAGGMPAPEGLTAQASPSIPAGAAGSSTASLIERTKNILLSPKQEWALIAAEPTSIAQLYLGYAMPLMAFAALVSFVRLSLIGVSMPFGGAIRSPLTGGLTYALLTFVVGLVGLFLVGIIINLLAPTFSGQRDQRQSLKAAAYSFTPSLVGSVFGLLPSFATLLQLLAGLYGIYLLYLGLPPVMRAPREKAAGYTALVVICTILFGILLGVLSTAVGGFGRLTGMVGAGGPGALSAPGSAAEAQQQGAAAVGNALGGLLGTDAQGKAGLGAAIANLAKTGDQIEQQQQTATPSDSAAADDSAPSSGDIQGAASAVTGLMTALGGALGGSRRVDPVDFQSLSALLPASLPGMQRTNVKGSNKQALGVKGSSATGEYQGSANARVEISIADASGVSGLMDLAGALEQTTSASSDTGYEKDATLGGRTVHEKYNSQSRHGELSVILAKRFEVDVSGDNVDMASLERALGSVDLARLEAMKDVGAKTP